MLWTVAFLSQYPESVLAKNEVECGYGERRGIDSTLETKAQGKKDGLASLTALENYSSKFALSFSKGNRVTTEHGNL